MASSEAHIKTLALAGYMGSVPVRQIHGKSYVEVEALARLASGSVSFHQDQITLTLPASQENAVTAAAASQPAKEGFSRDFLRAWIEEMSTIREWHSALESGIRNQIPIWQAWLEPYQSRATTNLQLAQAVATTDADHSAAQLIVNDYEKMKQLNDKYVGRAASARYIAPGSLANDALDQSVVACGQSLEAMAANGQFVDDGICD
jgi:hypothetical protein